jgi:hypothetical protein
MYCIVVHIAECLMMKDPGQGCNSSITTFNEHLAVFVWQQFLNAFDEQEVS